MTRTHRPSSFARVAALCATAAALGAAVGCGAPSRAEGVANGQQFSVSDAEPEVRSSGTGATRIVLAQEQRGSTTSDDPEAGAEGDKLWLVILTLPEGFKPEAGETVTIGPEGSGKPTLEVAVGDLEVEEHDGKRVATTSDTRFVPAVSGEMTFWNVEKILAADFTAQLEDGGTVRGSFEIAAD